MTLPKYVENARILTQKERMEGVFEIIVSSEKIAAEAKPGQFVQLGLPEGETILRRPVGIAARDEEKKRLTFFYRVVGHGTGLLASHQAGDNLSILGPLGHGFSVEAKRPLLVGGGIGLSPLLSWAQAFPGRADVLMGGRTAVELFWQEDFRPFVREIHITTDDGSLGTKGFTVAILPELLQKNSYDCVMVCGPERMMRAAAEIAQKAQVPCQVSLEKRMACGLGACLSCSVDGQDGRRRKVCKDGPVFWAEEVFP